MLIRGVLTRHLYNVIFLSNESVKFFLYAVTIRQRQSLLISEKETFMEIITNFLSDWGYTALFITMALENMNVPIPSEIILGFAGFLISQHIFSFWPTVIIGTAAGLAGSLLSYWIGAKGGRAVLLKYGSHMKLSNKKLMLADAWFEKYGGIAVFTGRLLPGIRTFISLPAGIAEYPLPHFIALTIAGTVPWTILLVYVGSLLGENWQTILDYHTEIAAGSVVVAVVIIAAYWYLNKKNA